MGESWAGWSDNRPSESWGSGQGGSRWNHQDVATRCGREGGAPDAKRLAWDVLLCSDSPTSEGRKGVVDRSTESREEANYF